MFSNVRKCFTKKLKQFILVRTLHHQCFVSVINLIFFGVFKSFYGLKSTIRPCDESIDYEPTKKETTESGSEFEQDNTEELLFLNGNVEIKFNWDSNVEWTSTSFI